MRDYRDSHRSTRRRRGRATRADHDPGRPVADLAFENFVLRRLYERELIERIHGDAALARIRRTARKQRQSQKAAAA